MQQMLLTLLAIILLALFAFGRQAEYMRTQEVAIAREIDTAMMDIKQIWESHMQDLPYAEEIANGTLVSATGFGDADLAALDQPMGPDTGENPADPDGFDDFDDFHGYATADYRFPVRGVDLPFTVEVDSVWYTDALVPGARSATKAARLRVSYVYTRIDLDGADEVTSLEQIVMLSING